MPSINKPRKLTGHSSEGRPVADWERIEAEYRAGQLSIREIAKSHTISHVAVMKRAKRDGWERNLAAAVREKVTTRLVTDGVTAKSIAETVELAAERGVQVVREHRKIIGRARAIAGELVEELGEDDRPLKDRAAILSNLSGSIKTLVALERSAFGLDNNSSEALDPPATSRDLSGLSDDDLDAVERIVRKVAVAGGNPGGEASSDT